MEWEGREEERSGESGQDFFGFAGILAEPIRLKQSSLHVICCMISALSTEPHL